ncbi:MAG: diacylglycerol kinase family protein [Alphaproteobacteria bacterium]|nr:diacylglycerol kinase family protein [Alphaproteobacteria bacterium]
MQPAAEASSAPTRASVGVRRALVLLNEKAGSVGPKAGAQLIDALNAAGVEQFTIVDATRMSRRHFQRASQFDAIVVLGGDGTARHAAELAPRDGPPLILLPGGTLNILPKALYGDLAWPEAIKAVLERGVELRLPVGRANGEAFYVAGLFGPTTLLALARESVREGKPLKALQRLRHALNRSFTRSIRARAGNAKMRKAEGIGVLLPSFSGGIESDHLEWVRLDARHFLDLARVSLRAITADWRNDRSVEISETETGDIYAAGIIPATLDGEPRTFISNVRITFDKRGPKVLALAAE